MKVVEMKIGGPYLQRGMTLLELTVVLLILLALAGLAVPYIGGTGSTAMCQATDVTMQTVKAAIMGGPAGVGYYADLLGQYPRDKGVPSGYSLHYLFVRDDGLDNDGDTHNSNPSFDGVFDPDDEWQSYNAKTGVGWRGPYLMNGMMIAVPVGSNFITATYAHAQSNGQSGINDGWNRPLVLQVPNPASCDKLTGIAGTKAGQCARLISAGPGSGLGSGDADIDTLIDDDPDTAAVIEDRRSNDDRILYLRIPSPAGDENVPCDQT